jgi:D-alanyl-lipoteichoic acid acyltransferase DltB (MBOAT superfamily)
MLLNSLSFIIVFLPAVALVYWQLRSRVGPALAAPWLLVASLGFYSFGNPRTLPILIASAIANFLIGRMLGRRTAAGRPDARLLALGVTLNVALLSTFKYSGFVAENINALTGSHLSALTTVLPLGISFFSLQQVMYLVDCHEGLVVPNRLGEHALFVSFFPYISAGPITRTGDVVPQLSAATRVPTDYNALARALFLFAIGLVKKAALADELSKIVDDGFVTGTAAPSQLQAWLSSAGFSLQLYFDFSGYSDMALGVALLLGVTLPANFDSPYRSPSIIDFWRRWHITLSNFITTYLYAPMLRGVRKVTLTRASFATMASMLVAGLWHGAAWTYVVFGGMHGAALVVNQLWRKKIKIRVPFLVGVTLTATFVNIAFVVFHSTSLPRAATFLRIMLIGGGVPRFQLFSPSARVAILATGLGIVAFAPNSNALAQRFKPTWGTVFVTAVALVLGIVCLNSGSGKEFAYVDF